MTGGEILIFIVMSLLNLWLCYLLISKNHVIETQGKRLDLQDRRISEHIKKSDEIRLIITSALVRNIESAEQMNDLFLRLSENPTDFAEERKRLRNDR
jgi:dTDP-4-dehydrorhamnose reductase